MDPAGCGRGRQAPPIRAYPPGYWDGEASRWDSVVAMRTNPHQFYYLEADYMISKVLERSMRALELGCGTGGSTAVHARELSELVATDFSREMVRRAAKRRTADRVHFTVADASRLPFRDAAFDAVFSRGVLLSYVPEPRRALREIRRVMRPGGSLALDAMNRLSGSPRKRTGLFCRVGGRPAYVEYAVRTGLQIRWIHWLSEDSSHVPRAEREERPRSRPRNLRDHVTSVARDEGRLFRPRELARR